MMIGLLLLCVTVIMAGGITIEIFNVGDQTAQPSDCYPTANPQCNLRSAWGACISMIGAVDNCSLILPPFSYINVSLEPLVMMPNISIELDGRGSTIFFGGNKTEVDNSEINITGGDFPLYVSTTDTNYARQNTIDGCVNACPGDTLRFTVCDNGETSEDTSFRLFQNGTEIAVNEDFCHWGAEITYAVPYDASAPCDDFCLHAGCWNTEPCTDTVVAYKTLYQDDDGYRLFNYSSSSNNNNNNNEVNPALTVQNATIADFRAGTKFGGVLFADGSIDVLFDHVSFINNSALDGGSIYVTNTGASSFKLEHCQFDQSVAAQNGGALYMGEYVFNFSMVGTQFNACSAKNGGAVHINKHNVNLSFSDTIFESCVATPGWGGAVYLEELNNDISFVGTDFQNCTAVSGGGILVYSSNNRITFVNSTFSNNFASANGGGLYVREGNERLTFHRTLFRNNSALSDGGALRAYGNNHYMTFSDCDFEQSTANDNGGALFLLVNNDYVTITHSRFQGNSAVQGYGGCIYVDNANAYFTVIHTQFTGCYAAENGGALWALSNDFMKIDRCTMTGCSARRGGGLFLETQSNSMTFASSNVHDCRAIEDGGGVYLRRSNENNSFLNSTFSACSAGSSGGAIALESKNIYTKIENCVITNCTAAGGGGGVASVSNDNLRFDNTSILYCNATEGGGFALLGDAVGTRMHLCHLEGNAATQNGGAIVALDSIGAITIAGSMLLRNHAELNGGAVYQKTNNQNSHITDADGESALLHIESPHPYEYIAGKPIIHHIVSFPDAYEVIMHFDTITAFANQDTVTIYAVNNHTGTQTIIFQAQGNERLPGIHLPSIRTEYTDLVITMEGYSDFYTASTSVNDELFGIKLYILPLQRQRGELTKFYYNTAGLRGGGIFMFSDIPFAKVLNAHFYRNTAGTGGGGMYIRNAMNGMVIQSVLFEENASPIQGGAVLMSLATYGFEFKNVTFHNNSAGDYGGGVAIQTNNGFGGGFADDNEILFSQCRFTFNVAINGGALYLDDENAIVLRNSTMDHNTGNLRGAGIYTNTENTLVLENVSMANNFAGGCGGGMGFNQKNTVNVMGLSIVNNTAIDFGGGICVIDDTNLTFESGTNVLQGNRATILGGGLALQISRLWKLNPDATLSFIENTAGRGSAVYFNSLKLVSNLSLHDVEFIRNHASIGGTVYWLFNKHMMEEPPGLSDATSNLVWEDNTALFGERYGTQGISVVAPDLYEVSVYNQALDPPITIQVKDVYDQHLPLDEQTTAAAEIVSPDPSQCNNRFPFLSGTDIAGEGVAMSNGLATFENLELYCYPQSEVVVRFEVRQFYLYETLFTPELPYSAYYVSNETLVSFRPCTTGEYILDGECVSCPRGSYSIEHPVTSDTSCADCTNINGVNLCYGDQIILEDGFWRRFAGNEAVLACPLGVAGCSGGNLTGTGVCQEGYTGNLCADCDNGYFLSGGACAPCESSGRKFSPEIWVFMCIGTVVAFMTAYISYAKIVKRSPANPTADKPEGIGKSSKFWVLQFKDYIQTHWRKMIIKAKIVVTTYQIVSTIPFTTGATFPTIFMSFVNAIRVVNLNFSAAIPMSCSQTYTFVDRLIFATVMPICLSVMIVVVGLAHRAVVAATTTTTLSEQDREEKLSHLVSSYLTIFFYLTYLILPSVTTTIFRTFLCTNLDPNGEDDADSDWYLTADMNISCTSDYYYNGVYYAIAMLFVYPIGIPLLYYILLNANKDEIKGRQQQKRNCTNENVKPPPTSTTTTAAAAIIGEDGNNHYDNHDDDDDDDDDEEALVEANLSPATERLTFLWNAYEPQFWYWEVVEAGRRIVLTAVLSVIFSGTSTQAILAVIVSLTFVKMYSFYEPYGASDDNITAEVGQYQIFFTFFGAMIYQRSLLRNEWNLGVGIALTAINLTVVILFGIFEYRNYSAKKEQEIQMHRVIEENEDNEDEEEGQGMMIPLEVGDEEEGSSGVIPATDNPYHQNLEVPVEKPGSL